MSRLAAALILAAAVLVGCIAPLVSDSRERSQRQWLMMVRTINTDPAREKEFNDWYDDIDVPDVLKVPGYWRARRGRTLPVASAAATAAAPSGENAHYVALYNIESPAIDKTIIDMLMATWKMITVGRDTTLLKVIERVYYRQYAASYAVPSSHVVSGKHFLFLERFDVAKNGDANRLNAWYDSTYRRAMMSVPGMVGATRYELYRVLMFEPKYAPRFLTVYDIVADSTDQARHSADILVHLDDARRASAAYVGGESTLYLEIKDVRRD